MMILALFAQVVSAASGRPCGFAPDIVQSAGVGKLRIGMTVTEIRAKCAVRADRRDYDDEGNRIRLMDVGTPNNKLTVRLESGRTYNIWTTSPAFRTRSGLGVNTSLAALLRQFPDLQGGQSEGGPLFVFSDHLCGISFKLGYKVSENEYARHGDDWQRLDLMRIPARTRVVGVLITGCQTH